MGTDPEKDDHHARLPEDVQDEGRTPGNDEKPVMEELGEAPAGEHSG
jgi:hypothetical protein